jgi:ABC-type transport system involved in multi-copper enzyme maturation permease subunit
MWKALLLKEWRDTSLTLGVAAVALALWVAEMTGWGFFTPAHNFDVQSPAPLKTANQWFVLILSAAAIGLAMQQTVPESNRQTWLFLLHRPLDRRVIPLAKWGAGMAVWCTLALVPFLLYLIWAAGEGHHASPFVWRHTYGWWQTIAGISLLYSGAFLSGLRPAKWLGTRLFPLFAAAVWMFFCWAVTQYGGVVCLAYLAGTIALHVLSLKLVLEVAEERDYP